MICLALYLPGHFLAPALTRKGDGWGELLLLRVVVGAAVACPVLVALALAGWFTVPAIVVSLCLCALACAVAGRAFRTGDRARRSGWDFATLGLILAGLALYARPVEYVINARDPGVYALFAAKLARTGGLLHRDPLVGEVARFHLFVDGIKYPGFYVYGQDLIVPQFFPGAFAFLGLGSLIGGAWGSLYVVPIFGALAVGAAFALGSELFGRWAGLAGAALLAASYTQIWWSRHPSSEVVTQFFVLCGLWLSARFATGAGPLTGVLAGVLLGGAMLVRPDAFLAAAVLPLLFGYDLLTRRPARRWLLPGVPLALFAGAALLYLNTVGGRYLNLAYRRHGLDGALALAPYVLGVAAVLAVGLFVIRRRYGGRLGNWMEIRGTGVAVACALCVVGVVLWGYFVAPVPWESLPEGSRDFDAYRSQILVRLTWFVTPIVGILALLGLVLAARRLDAARTVLLGAVLGFGFLYALVPNVAPDLPWATRRFVPAVFPGLCLLASFAAVETGRWMGRVRGNGTGIVVAGLLSLLAFGWTAQVALKIPVEGELAGAVGAFGRIEAEMPEAEVVFVEAADATDPAASTFEYLYDRPVLPYGRERFWREGDGLREAGLLEDALYITTDGGPPPLLSEIDFREVGRGRLDLPRLSPSETTFPTETERLRMDYRVFRVQMEDR